MRSQFLKMSLFFCVLLSGCQDEAYSRYYLLTNPSVLKSEYFHCQKNKFNQEYCDRVLRTMEDFVGLVNVHDANQQQFGMQILDAQEQLAKLTTDLARENTQTPKNLAKIQSLEQASEVTREKIEVLLSVVGATS
jgi:hypothetical protein